MKMPTSTEEGQNMRAWVTHHSLSSLQDFLMWELVHLQYGDISACFPSRDSIRHIVMLWKYICHLVQHSQIQVASDDPDNVLDPSRFIQITFHEYMSWKANEITT